uniref:Immunoglobulin V-set domain-containing protein n=1 Tax=Meleagris gallopavo TaxID=9103 RepID=A0A803Y9B7_MELGA
MDHAAFLVAVLQLFRSKISFLFLAIIFLSSSYIITDMITTHKCAIVHKENIAVLHPIYGIHIEDKYRGRIYFENTSREDQSLSFNKSTLEDVGLYFCSIVTYPDGVSEKIIEVIHPGKEISHHFLNF